MTDKEKDICGGDDQSIDRFLPLDAPSGFERTGSVVASLRTDLENHDPPASDYDMHIEAADIDAVIRTFDSELVAVRLSNVVKLKIRKSLEG